MQSLSKTSPKKRKSTRLPLSLDSDIVSVVTKSTSQTGTSEEGVDEKQAAVTGERVAGDATPSDTCPGDGSGDVGDNASHGDVPSLDGVE